MEDRGLPAVVAVVRCRSYDRPEVEDAAARAVELLGGAGCFFRPRERVLLKPNLLAPRPRDSRVTTDPEVVRALAVLAERNGCAVTYGDSPGIGGAARVLEAAGYATAMEGLRAQPVELSEPVAVRGIELPRVELAREVVSADALVNVAKAKTHGQMTLTLAVKNLFGCVPGTRKAAWHLRAGKDRDRFASILVEVAAASRARLHVLDAVVGMEGNGPGSGTPREFGALLASRDPVALDSVACDMLGVPEGALSVIGAARRLGFGEADRRRIELVGDDPSPLRIRDLRLPAGRGIHRFLPMPSFVAAAARRLFVPGPVFDARACRSCGLCAGACPARCLRPRRSRPPAIDRERCIGCLCCQEVCPHGAVRAGGGWLSRLFG